MRRLSWWNGACPYVLQVFQIRNDSRSGGTLRPELSATAGSLDPGLGVNVFRRFFDHFEAVDSEFE
jgi:aminopeptidase I